MSAADALLGVGLAAVLGAIVGVERDLRGQHAGMRTHALVAVGAALFTMAGAYGFPDLPRAPMVDPMRVAAQVASGVGFIGAGAILRERGSVRGITTAAALWTSAALGVACGAGLYLAALVVSIVVLLVLAALRSLKDRRLGRHILLDITYRRGSGTLGPLLHGLESAGAALVNLHIEDDDVRRHVSAALTVKDKERLQLELRTIAELPEVDRLVLGEGR